MKKFLKVLAGTFIALVIFVLTLEGMGFIFLKIGHNPLEGEYPPPRPLSERGKQVTVWVREWLELKRNELNPEVPVDQVLRNEPGHYSDVGLLHRQDLWGGDKKNLAPGIDDEFMLVGKDSGKVKWRARYRTDSYGHRLTHQERKKNAKRNLVFLGCSFTFGQGVGDELTFPARAAEYFPESQTYNFGIQGSSPTRILESLMKEGSGYLAAVDDKPGAVILTYIDDHIRRIVGTSGRLIQHYSIIETDPHFYLSDGKLEYRTSFADDPLGRYYIFRFLGSSQFVKALGLEFPFINQSHFELVAKVVAGIRDEIRKVRPDLQFYFSFYPAEEFYRRPLLHFLARENVEVLDYSEVSLENSLGNQRDLGTDRHPSPQAHDLYAYLLGKDLESRVP